MVKIVIMDEKSVFEKTVRDVEEGNIQKEDKIVYFRSIDDFRKILTNERMRVMRTVKLEKPSSIYELAKILKRDFKSVIFDCRFLEGLGLMSLEKFKVGMRVKVRPRVKAEKIEMEMAI